LVNSDYKYTAAVKLLLNPQLILINLQTVNSRTLVKTQSPWVDCLQIDENQLWIQR